MLQEATIWITDEVTLLSRKLIEVIDNTLRDIRSPNYIMGGLLTLLCGDFRQILPVVPHGTRSNKNGLQQIDIYPFIILENSVLT